MSKVKLKPIFPGMVIYCRTFEQAKLLAENSSMGKVFTKRDFHWHIFKESTCYHYEQASLVDRSQDIWSYAYYSHFTDKDYKIINFEDLIIKEEESEDMSKDKIDISPEKIDESLRVLREVCHAHNGVGMGACSDCPLRTYEGDGCYLDASIYDRKPKNWVLKSDKAGRDNRMFD